MDLMQIRRQMMGVIAGMASGAYFEKGSFTATTSYTTFNFSKTFSKYMIIIEMTDASKQTLLDSGVNGNRTYAYLGIYPKRKIGEAEEPYNACAFRVNPSTGATNQTYNQQRLNATNFQLQNVNAVSGAGTTDYISGATYNWYVVEIKD